MRSCIDKAAMFIATVLCVVCACYVVIEPLTSLKPVAHTVSRVELGDLETTDMQIELNRRGHDLVVDGIHGPKTNAALMSELGK
jgi:hypothetical protein